MKRYSFILSFIIAVGSFTASAQSTFIFQNYHPVNLSLLNAPVFDAEGNVLSGATYSAELWGGASTDSLFPTVDYFSGQRVFTSFGTGIAAGYFTANATMAVNQVGGGQFAWVQVRAWNTQLGATWEEVAALGMGGYGESSLLFLQGGNPDASPPVGPHYLFGLQSFSLRPVPEPAVWQLGIIGFAALLFLRRKGTG